MTLPIYKIYTLTIYRTRLTATLKQKPTTSRFETSVLMALSESTRSPTFYPLSQHCSWSLVYCYSCGGVLPCLRTCVVWPPARSLSFQSQKPRRDSQLVLSLSRQ